jgi:hypothetical protein
MMNNLRSFLYLCILSLLSFPAVLFADYETFTNNFQQVGIDISTVTSQSSISRFEMTRLLNAIKCEDCIVPPLWMKQTYTLDFRKTFSSLPNKDFQDISYLGASRNQKSYYYCVAYVGDNEYMRGYPATTSPICGGKFCGQNAVTTSEFFQTILNLITPNLLSKYQTNRTDIKSWLKGLSTTSYQYQVLTDTDIKSINNANTTTKAITNAGEFQAYLKYCMFHLNVC